MRVTNDCKVESTFVFKHVMEEPDSILVRRQGNILSPADYGKPFYCLFSRQGICGCVGSITKLLRTVRDRKACLIRPTVAMAVIVGPTGRKYISHGAHQ